ncbi:PDZ domain-containing protein [Streptomyces sp. NPDC091377]|uniref:PDZ domain-containing protein n=1 Tax=Streptomyces sp. NPDC091377 TaxID=3365995 RepID=UPI0037F2603F
MEQTALRPKPMPGRVSGTGRPGGAKNRGEKAGATRRPHAARRRNRRLRTLLLGLLAGTVLVLSGVGIGTVGATVIGMSTLADLRRQPPEAAGPVPRTAPGGTAGVAGSDASVPPGSPALPGATLGAEAVDAEKPGALLVGVHVPGPGHSAGLVRGDVLLTFDGTRVDAAADLARAVRAAEPGKPVTVTVRHDSGGYQQLSVTPGYVL